MPIVGPGLDYRRNRSRPHESRREDEQPQPQRQEAADRSPRHRKGHPGEQNLERQPEAFSWRGCFRSKPAQIGIFFLEKLAFQCGCRRLSLIMLCTNTCLAPPSPPFTAARFYLVLQAVTWKMKTDALHRMVANKNRRTMRGRVYRPSEDACIVPSAPPGEEPTPMPLPPSDDVCSVAQSFLAAKVKHATDSRHPPCLFRSRRVINRGIGAGGRCGERCALLPSWPDITPSTPADEPYEFWYCSLCDAVICSILAELTNNFGW